MTERRTLIRRASDRPGVPAFMGNVVEVPEQDDDEPEGYADRDFYSWDRDEDAEKAWKDER